MTPNFSYVASYQDNASVCSNNWQALQDGIEIGDAVSGVAGIKYMKAGLRLCADPPPAGACDADYTFDDTSIPYLGPMGTRMDIMATTYATTGIKFYDTSDAPLGIHTTCSPSGTSGPTPNANLVISNSLQLEFAILAASGNQIRCNGVGIDGTKWLGVNGHRKGNTVTGDC